MTSWPTATRADGEEPGYGASGGNRDGDGKLTGWPTGVTEEAVASVVTVRRRGRRCRGSRKVGEAVRGGLGGEWPKPLVAAGVRRQAVRLPTLPSLPLQAVNRPRLVARSQVDSQPETVAKPRRDWGWPHRYSPNNLGCPVKLASTHRGTWSSRLFPSMRTSPEAVMRVSHPRAPKMAPDAVEGDPVKNPRPSGRSYGCRSQW